MATASLAAAPKQTLYVRNLEERTKKKELRESLYQLFSQFGQVIDVVALKTMKMRGQAFVVFSDVSAAALAMRSLQGFPLYDKPMSIAYAKTQGNAVRVVSGKMLRRKGAAAGDGDSDSDGEGGALKRTHAGDGELGAKRMRENEEENEDEDANVVLFVSQLPDTETEESLATLFGQYDGFKDVRVVPGRSDIAFVEYDTTTEAGKARSLLNGFQISPGRAISVEFAKKA
ncbi:hypothetical protein HK105_207944 [Polyrhizophydium stewartii]|uniref:RRM domain-containing protein n=1 Tax=Polyrhizophydium stewartii TaxID=2732419 RepID=A0ABR4MZ57_9FUNG